MMSNDELKNKMDAVELADDDLEQVSGGMILNATGLPECEPGRPWEVIHNNTGEVLSRWSTQNEACWAAQQYHSGSSYDTQICTVDQVNYLRTHSQLPAGQR